MINQWGDRKLGENASAGEQAGAAPSRRAAAPVPELGDLRRGGGARTTGSSSCRPTRMRKPSALSRHAETRRHVSGFDLTREDAIADPGWFFVIQQQPTEPRFGMDVANFEKPLPDARRHVERSELAASGQHRRGIEGAVARLDQNGAAGRLTRRSGAGTPRIRRISRCNARCASPFTRAK